MCMTDYSSQSLKKETPYGMFYKLLKLFLKGLPLNFYIYKILLLRPKNPPK